MALAFSLTAPMHLGGLGFCWGFHYVALTGLKLTETHVCCFSSWGYRHVPPCPNLVSEKEKCDRPKN